MNDICDKMGEASEDEMNAMMEELGTIQDLLMAHDFLYHRLQGGGDRPRLRPR